MTTKAEERKINSVRRRYKIAAGLDVNAARRVIQASEANEQMRQARIRMAEELAKIDRALERLEADTYTIKATPKGNIARKRFEGRASGPVDVTLCKSATRAGLKAIMARRFPDHILITHHVGYTQIVDGARHEVSA
jgi:hypothetical protein